MRSAPLLLSHTYVNVFHVTHMHARARTNNDDNNNNDDQHVHTFQSGGSWAPNPRAGNILSLRRKPWQQIGSFVKPFFFPSEFNMLDFQQRRKSCYLFCKETHSRTFTGESCWKKIGLYCRMPRQWEGRKIFFLPSYFSPQKDKYFYLLWWFFLTCRRCHLKSIIGQCSFKWSWALKVVRFTYWMV